MIKAVQAITRAVFTFTLAAVVGAGGWVGYQFYERNGAEARLKAELEKKDVQIEQQEVQIEQQQEEISRLDTALRLMKVNRRVARIDVLDQYDGPDGKFYTRIQFTELDPNAPEKIIGQPKDLTIEGDLVYVDALVIKFKDEYIEEGDDPLRSASICLFTRIFGENQTPNEGFRIDEKDQRPEAYARGTIITPVEREMWANFWEYANNPDLMKAAGIRAIHGEAPSQKLQREKSYRVELRASGGLEIGPPEDMPLAPGRAG